jgi:hypothetical protein
MGTSREHAGAVDEEIDETDTVVGENDIREKVHIDGNVERFPCAIAVGTICLDLRSPSLERRPSTASTRVQFRRRRPSGRCQAGLVTQFMFERERRVGALVGQASTSYAMSGVNVVRFIWRELSFVLSSGRPDGPASTSVP